MVAVTVVAITAGFLAIAALWIWVGNMRGRALPPEAHQPEPA